MRLRLKEDPREWRKFAWVLSSALGLATALLVYRAGGFQTAAAATLVVGIVILITGSLWPKGYRPVYRLAMRASHAIGQVMGRILLCLLFVFLLLPLGLLLRLAGKDLLQLKKAHLRHADSYWGPVKPPGPLDRMF